MTQGEYWSIGEVLSLLQDEFPEITISKIRFLESQGLIEPERTPSGYRRFYQTDFDLLQWILVQQRDHYLPLKVIRDRIQSGDTEQGLLDFSGVNGDHPPTPAVDDSPNRTAPNAESQGSDSGATGHPAIDAADDTGASPTEESTAAASSDDEPKTRPSGAAPSGGRVSQPTSPGQEPSSATSPGSDVSGSAASNPQASNPQASNPQVSSPGSSHGVPAPVSEESATNPAAGESLPPLALTRDELAESSGCSITMISDLERYGLVKGRKAGPTVLYDNTALLITRIAAQFATFGLEPRHLRTFLIGAEREMGLVHQVVEPMLHRRDEETRRKAHETLEDLTDLAGSLRSILMRQATEELLPKH